MWTVSSQVIHLTPLSSHNKDRPSNTGGDPPVSSGSINPGPSSPVVRPIAIGENKLDFKSIAYSGAKLILNGVKESADGPLQTVAGCLCFILDNCEVRRSHASTVHSAYRY